MTGRVRFEKVPMASIQCKSEEAVNNAIIRLNTRYTDQGWPMNGRVFDIKEKPKDCYTVTISIMQIY